MNGSTRFSLTCSGALPILAKRLCHDWHNDLVFEEPLLNQAVGVVDEGKDPDRAHAPLARVRKWSAFWSRQGPAPGEDSGTWLSQKGCGGIGHVVSGSAWGKIKKSEEILGVKLITQSGSKKEGCQLSESGQRFMESYLLWFEEVERTALQKAEEILPWTVTCYKPGKTDQTR